MRDAVNAATVVAANSDANSGLGATCSMAVPKNYYYQVQDAGSGHTTYYMDFTSVGS